MCYTDKKDVAGKSDKKSTRKNMAKDVTKQDWSFTHT